jgi:predicted dehydrogenase
MVRRIEQPCEVGRRACAIVTLMRVAVIGLGYWGPNLVRNLASSPATELVAICDRDPARLASIGAQYPSARQLSDSDEVFASDDVDAVCVATPVATHYPLVKQALEAGKHVLVEKPFVQEVAQAEELVALARERGLVLMLDHVFLFSPAVRRLAESVSSGELGDIQYVDSVRINLGLVQQDVNVLWDLAAHDLSIMDHLVGRLPLSVGAFGEAHQGHDLADVAYLHLDYGDGLIASVHVNWLSPVKIRHFLVGGTRRSALYNELDPSERLKIYDRGVDSTPDRESKRQIAVSYRSGDVVAPRLDPMEPLRAMVEHFAECVHDGKTPISDGEQGLRIVRILAASEESLARRGASIELPVPEKIGS